jgi:CRP-like cAMP-binding protein
MLRGLEQVELRFGHVLYEPEAPLRHVYFPNDSLISLLAVVEGEDALEVGLVGRDSMVGMPLALGNRTSPVRSLVQGGGSAMRMSAARFLKELERNPDLRRMLARCAYVAMTTAMQIAACNRAHVLEARLARWLLMVRDRLGRDDFQLTQQFLALMLGVRRAGVTGAASALQKRNLIRYSRGKMSIVDAVRLRRAACSCYAVIRKLEKSES